MARTLSKKQKNYLDKISEGWEHPMDWQELDWEHQKKLELMRDYETLWCDVERYLHDRVWERRNARC